MTQKTGRPTTRTRARHSTEEVRDVISLHDTLTLPNGQVLPNRIMKSALSEALADKRNGPDHRLAQLYRTWSQGGYGLIITAT